MIGCAFTCAAIKLVARSQPINNNWLPAYLRHKRESFKARFHYERGKKHSLFVLLLFFALASIEDQ